MVKNLALAGLVLVLILVGGFAWKERAKLKAAEAKILDSESKKPPQRPNTFLKKGDKLADSDLNKYATLVYPGELSDAAKKAMVGFNLKTTALKDGSTQVDFVPKDSDDEFQSYVVKPGNSLYFVEMSPGDDTDGLVDKTYRDDYGVVVDKDGLVQ